MKQGIVMRGMDTCRAWVIKILVVSCAALAGCASAPAGNTSTNQAGNQHIVSVQCTSTDTNVDTPCVEEARQTCTSEPHLKDVTSRSVIPATQGVAQAAMPLTRYVVRYTCQ
jgi:PBP1b-binding outer membrane lipoprotein LpoB